VMLQRVLAVCNMQMGRYAEAVKMLEALLARRPNDVEILTELANAHLWAGNFASAHQQFDKALAIDPALIHAIGGKASAFDRQGDYDGVETLLKSHVDVGRETPGMAVTYARMLQHRKRFEEASALTVKHLSNPNLDAPSRHFLCEQAAKAFEKLGQYDKAFAAFSTGNALKAAPFDPDEYVAKCDELIAIYSAANLAKLPRSRLRSDVPIFIASMPRSGSTLVEQIIHAHPKAFGAGEITQMHEIALGLPRLLESMQPYPACLGDFKQTNADALAKSYLDDLRELDARAARIVNKHLENYKHLGLIELLLPGARVVHVKRDPLDNCFSCYMAQISTQAYPWVSDLRHLAVAYKEYERIMAHWHQVLSIPILDVQYEDLVEDTETWIRRIIDFCGLPWDDACLRYYEADRSVMTLSYDQVRQPIYKSAVKRHEKYDEFLGPLKEELARGRSDG
jgi:tetratricopeptide (TPR) repeat protein